MTPAQLAVERDALLGGGRTMETVGAMQAAAGGWLQIRVAVAVREYLARALASRARRSDTDPERGIVEECLDIIGRVDLTPIIESASPSETRTGASAPQGETP